MPEPEIPVVRLSDEQITVIVAALLHARPVSVPGSVDLAGCVATAAEVCAQLCNPSVQPVK